MNGTATRADARRTLLAALVATVVMLFTAFAAAYLERRSTTDTWTKIPLPALVWINTILLLLSSATVEAARRRGTRAALQATIALGVLFLAGQVSAWLQLREAGVFLPTSPHGSFFYILSGVHGVHVAAALIALAAALRRPAILGVCAGFWHTMGLVWLYVLFVLVVL